MEYLKIQDDDYGNLLPYIKDDNITDINWNGYKLWLDDLQKGRYAVDTILTDDFIKVFSQKIGNAVNCNFNRYESLLEAETDELRISILHEDVTNTGRSISIRKTPAKRRISTQSAIKNKYCTKLLADFLQACVKANMAFIVSGLPGTGKTECVKYLTKFIDKVQRVITIEDNLEIRYNKINPDSDGIEIKVDKDFTYADAIKCSLRQRPDWIILSESRGREAKYLLESASTGASCMTTLHTDNVLKIPDRIINMIGQDGKQSENDIYSFFDIGILITRRIEEDKIHRYISQLCIFDRQDGVNKTIVIYEKDEFITTELPFNILHKFNEKQINNPLESVKVE